MKAFLFLLPCSLALWLASLAGCGGSKAGQPGGPLREPDEYTGCATDEHWRTFDDQAAFAVVADATGPALTAPASGATLPFASKPILTWNQDPNDPGMALGDVPHDGPACINCCPEYNTGALTTQHLPPISGDVYDLQFTTDGSVSHRVISTLQEWTPPDALWAAWKGKTVSLRIFRMTVIRNDPRPGSGGPFVATTPATFSIGS